MPYCKKCKSRIDRFDKDRCPICGEVNPFDGVSSDTIEITTAIDTSNIKDIDYHPRKRKTLLLLFIFLGVFGAPYFYLYRKKEGIFHLITDVTLDIAATLILYFLLDLHIALAIIIPLAIDYLFNIAMGIYLYKKPSIKDGRGEFLI